MRRQLFSYSLIFTTLVILVFTFIGIIILPVYNFNILTYIPDRFSSFISITPLDKYYNFKREPKDFINNSRIRWSKGWTKIEKGSFWDKEAFFQSHLPGSEFDFKFVNGSNVNFLFETSKTEPLIGIEIWSDNNYFDFSYPNFKPEQTVINLENNKQGNIHHLRGRVYCFFVPAGPCDLLIKSIIIDDNARVLSQGGRNRKKTLAILGDSISGVHGNKNYVFLLADKINYYLLNSSYSGSTMSDNENSYSGVSRIKTDVIPFKPDLLIIFLGTNDLGHKIGIDHLKQNYDKAVSLLKKELPKTTILALGLLPKIDFTFEEISSFSTVIKNIAVKYNIHYADTYDWLTKEDLLDGVHPKIESQEKIKEKIYTYLKENRLLDDRK